VAARRTLVTGGSGFLGTHVVEALSAAGREVINASTSAPRAPAAPGSFSRLDVRDASAVARLVGELRPAEIVHLAARTGFLTRPDPAGFIVNVEGTAHLAEAAAKAGAERFVLASSNVVDWEPSGPRPLLYGASKAAAERVIAAARGLACRVVVRPCYAWGPWFGAPFLGFFQAVARRRYLHPGAGSPLKLLGYAGNMAHQIVRLLDAPAAEVDGRVFHLADDRPTTLRAWAAVIAAEVGVPPPRTLPEALARAAARAGDALLALGFADPPLTSERLANMRRSNVGIPIQATRDVVGPLPFTMEAGVTATVRWMEARGLLERAPRRMHG
jgi:nucleoside-diphosphate-sugar epimerase